MSETCHDGHRRLQGRFDTRRLADRVDERFVQMVRVAVREVFPSCPRYIHRYELVERSRFVPRTGCETPVPDWKRREWARDVLPAGDPSRR